MPPIYEDENTTREQLQELRKKNICSVCRGRLDVFMDFDRGKAFLACGDWHRSRHESIEREAPPLFEPNIATRREEMEVKRDEVTQEQWDEMKKITQENVCGVCGAELQIHTNPERRTLEVGCLTREHHGWVERETYTQAMRRGEVVHPIIQAAIEKKMLLPGGYPLGTALALIKVRFPRADLDDPSAALFVMDCLRLDLDPLLGEIVPVTFKSTNKVTGEVRRIVTPILTEDGWLSLAARACPDRWAGPPLTEPITDKAFKKELCNDEEAWVWKATGKTKDGFESVTYGWVRTSEIVKDVTKQTPKDYLPGNQARVRSIKRWVRETFPEAKARMKEMTSEWLARGEGIEGVKQIIEAEYHIVTELPPSKPVVGGETAAPGAEEGKRKTEAAGAPPTEEIGKTQKIAGAPPAAAVSQLPKNPVFKNWGELAQAAATLGVNPSDVFKMAGRKRWEDFVDFRDAWNYVEEIVTERAQKPKML